MSPDYWRKRWQQGETGWHSDDINPHLSEHWSRVEAAPGSRVFVPLCGKSLDMLWLASRGHRVIGVEISEMAVQEFFADNALQPQITRSGPFTRYRADEIELLAGDFFDLRAEDLGEIQVLYDRGSLVALPPPMRIDYAAKLATLIPAGVSSLLIAFDYDQELMPGPPFAVGRDEVQRLFEPAFDASELADIDILADSPRFAARGLTRLHEHVYRVQRRS